MVPTGQFGTAIRQWWDEALIRHVLICCKSVKSITTIKLPLQKQITLPPVVRNCRRIQWRPIVRHCRANRRFDWRANACKWPTQGIVYHLWWSLIIIIIHRASIAVWMLLASHSPDYHAAMQSSRRHNAAHQQIILGSAPKKGTGSNTWRWSPPLLWTNWRNEEQDIETASCRSQESHRHCEWYCEEPVQQFATSRPWSISARYNWHSTGACFWRLIRLITLSRSWQLLKGARLDFATVPDCRGVTAWAGMGLGMMEKCRLSWYY